MMRRRGFTLIELLVVIAIIGILAAMLFPVFARARESARKTQCLANFKNLAIAFNMYLTDYDRFPPDETDSNVNAYFNSDNGDGPGGCGPCNAKQDCHDIGRPYGANPFLRVPVILDDYVKNRQVWQCPSAKISSGAGTIVPDYYPGGWLQYYKDTEGSKWGKQAPYPWQNLGPCLDRFGGAWPVGWGGSVTDTFIQGLRGYEDPEGFQQSIDVNVGPCIPGEGKYNAGMNLSNIEDTAKYVVVVEKPFMTTPVYGVLDVAYPNGARLSNYIGCDNSIGGGGDWSNCSWSIDCSVGDADHAWQFATSSSYRKQYSRHLGGSNLGFADGHAKWYPSDAILAAAPKNQGGGCCGPVVEKDLVGLRVDQIGTQPANGGPMPSGWSGCGFVCTPIY